MTGQPALIAVDWGTSSFRAYLVADDGAAVDRLVSADGILAAAPRGFADVLAAAVAPWRSAHGRVPVLLSGMIGSRQGWLEVPYLDCPADAAAIAGGLRRLDVPGLGQVHIVPGLLTRGRNGVTHALPDVMRGEETQILGALATSRGRSGLFVLPGTHSKWVAVEDGRIVDFATYMTGEVYAALRAHTILGRLMTSDEIDADGFARGVAAAGRAPGPAGSLLHTIFSARTLALLDRLAPHQIAGYLSGLLIGAEIMAAAPRAGEITIIASAGLAAHYAAAAAQTGLTAHLASPDCVATGQLALAREASLLEKQNRARP